jgi:hypothetical protein
MHCEEEKELAIIILKSACSHQPPQQAISVPTQKIRPVVDSQI